MMNGKAIAMTVAGLLMTAAPGLAQAQDNTKEAKVKCVGGNACKGKGACAAAKHSCAGENACKGQGWIETTAKDCKAKGGTVEAKKEEKKADKK
jgi:hypothetical protein